jgi:hypothetical protein
MLYGITSTVDQQRMSDANNAESIADMLWVAIYRELGVTLVELSRRLPLEEGTIEAALAELVADGRVVRASESKTAPLTAATFTVPVGGEKGWESAVYDHFQALTSAIANKLRISGARSSSKDLVGGATLSFDVYPGHPHESEVYGLLERVRTEVNELWTQVRAANTALPVSDDERVRVTFYFGQNVDDIESVEKSNV